MGEVKAVGAQKILKRKTILSCPALNLQLALKVLIWKHFVLGMRLTDPLKTNYRYPVSHRHQYLGASLRAILTLHHHDLLQPGAFRQARYAISPFGQLRCVFGCPRLAHIQLILKLIDTDLQQLHQFISQHRMENFDLIFICRYSTLPLKLIWIFGGFICG